MIGNSDRISELLGRFKIGQNLHGHGSKGKVPTLIVELYPS